MLYLQKRTFSLQIQKPLRPSIGPRYSFGTYVTCPSFDDQIPRLVGAFGARGLYGDHLGQTSALQSRERVSEAPNEMWGLAGLSQLQCEVLVVCPQSGRHSKLAGAE